MRVINGWRSKVFISVLSAMLLLSACGDAGTDQTAEADESNHVPLSELFISNLFHEKLDGIHIGKHDLAQKLQQEYIKKNYRLSSVNTSAYGYQGPLTSDPFDREWFTRDQAHFIHLFQQENTPAKLEKCYTEIAQLKQHQQEVISRVQSKHPDYRIFSPEETDEINSLFIAISARQNWLKDHLTGNDLADWEDYYPRTYGYHFFQMGSLNIQGGVEVVDIDVKDNFTAYDEAAIIAYLDGLPVPKKVYQGKEFFFINGANEDYGAVHANGQIIVFNLFDNTDEMMKLIAHEMGHEAGYLIFGRDAYENENEQMKKAYAGLHGKEVPVDDRMPWELRLSENFAEDFAWVYGGHDKWTYWRETDQNQVQGFIESSLVKAKLEEAILIRDNMKLITQDGQLTLFGGIHEDNLVIVRDPTLTIGIDGFYKGAYQVYAHWRNNVTGNLPRQPFNEQGLVTLQLAQLPHEMKRLEEEGYVMYEMQLKMYHYTSLQKYHQPTFARFHVVYWP